MPSTLATRLAIHLHGVPEIVHRHLTAYAAHRVGLALGRLAGSIERIVLRLSDENGPRGGVAARCLAEVRLRTGRQVVVEHRAEAWPQAIGAAVERAARAVHRQHQLALARHRRRRLLSLAR